MAHYVTTTLCVHSKNSQSQYCMYLLSYVYIYMVQYYGTMHSYISITPNTIYATKTYKAKIWLDEVFHDL